MRNLKSLELSGNIWKASDALIRVVSARKIRVGNCATRAGLAVNISIVENGGSSSDMFSVDLDEKKNRNFTSSASMSKGSADIGDKNAFEEAAAHPAMA